MNIETHADSDGNMHSFIRLEHSQEQQKMTFLEVMKVFDETYSGRKVSQELQFILSPKFYRKGWAFEAFQRNEDDYIKFIAVEIYLKPDEDRLTSYFYPEEGYIANVCAYWTSGMVTNYRSTIKDMLAEDWVSYDE